jgi:diguanylate cyclase (GGDEF)-like protein
MAQQDARYEQAGQQPVTGAEIILRAAEQRKRAALHRTQAAEHRAEAAADREAAAEDRAQGARDRLRALADRESLAHALAVTETDPLTGARERSAGLADLGHELDRCRRVNAPLVVVYVDAVGLKAINDSEGREAGDELLKRLVTVISEHLRTYDLVIRLAADEFLCAMSNMTLGDARERFSEVAAALASSKQRGAIRAGFAELQRDDSPSELIARADGQLLDSRRD